MLSGLFSGVFAALAAEGSPFVVFLLCGPLIGLYAGDGSICILAEFAFPDGDDGPGEGVEALGIEFIADDVAGYLFFPESGVRLGFDVLGATSVAVPEAAVDEDYGAVLGQDEVARSGTAAPGRLWPLGAVGDKPAR